jgi:hypothetical protein
VDPHAFGGVVLDDMKRVDRNSMLTDRNSVLMDQKLCAPRARWGLLRARVIFFDTFSFSHGLRAGSWLPCSWISTTKGLWAGAKLAPRPLQCLCDIDSNFPLNGFYYESLCTQKGFWNPGFVTFQWLAVIQSTDMPDTTIYSLIKQHDSTLAVTSAAPRRRSLIARASEEAGDSPSSDPQP